MSDTFDYAGQNIAFSAGDSVLLALTRAGIHPAGGGTLCFGGDCPNCLCTIEGVSYVRSCQTPAEVDVQITPHARGQAPPLPSWDAESTTIPVEHRNADIVVIGAGQAGQTACDEALAAAKTVECYDASRGEEVVAIYPGPLVLVRTPSGMIQTECADIVVATGAAEIHPVVPGSELRGLWTPTAARIALDAGIVLDNVVAIGEVPADLGATAVSGELVRFNSTGDGTVASVVTVGADGQVETACNHVIVGLGVNPRTGLARMANFMNVTVVGDAAQEASVPTCPSEGVICPCSNVTVGQLDNLHERGFTHMELLKRGSLAGTGTCQGSVCTPYLRSFLQDRGQQLQPPFTARPMARQLTLDEMAAGSHLPQLARTALDSTHRRLGATMERMGGWWRPWTYGDTDAEYTAVRQRVSLGDVSTLGKMIITGPDAEATLQRIFPTDVTTIKRGKSRYALMLDERGYLLDDGMIAREHDDTFFLTFTSSGASMAEMWIRDWSDSWGHDIRMMNQTLSLGAINVTGPLADQLLQRATNQELPGFLGHAMVDIAGIRCKVFRLSFTGEVSYELHHPAAQSEELWTALMDLGQDLGIRPHGIEALFRLRLEKGHIIVGQDTDYGANPRRLQHEWAINMDKGDFVGRTATERTNQHPLDRKLVGFETDQDVMFDGAVAWSNGTFAGTVSSTTWSPVLNKGIALAWLELIEGDFPEIVHVNGAEVTVVPPHFYDPSGGRARA